MLFLPLSAVNILFSYLVSIPLPFPSILASIHVQQQRLVRFSKVHSYPTSNSHILSSSFCSSSPMSCHLGSSQHSAFSISHYGSITLSSPHHRRILSPPVPSFHFIAPSHCPITARLPIRHAPVSWSHRLLTAKSRSWDTLGRGESFLPLVFSLSLWLWMDSVCCLFILG